MGVFSGVLTVLGITAGKDYKKTVAVQNIDGNRVETVTLTDGVVVTVNGQAVYQTCVGWTDVSGKKKRTTGYQATQ